MISVEPHELFERDGTDLHCQIPVTVFQAMLGASLEVPGILDEELEVKFEAGAQPGDVVTLRGVGMPAVNGGRRGNLLVHLRVVVPTDLSSEQRRLVEEAARLGGESGSGASGGLLERLKRAFGGDS